MNKNKFNELIAGFDFVTLFVHELGWNNFTANHPVSLPKTDVTFLVTGIAEKKDFPILLCSSSNGKIPEYNLRKQIERFVCKNLYFDHLIIFVDKHKTAQIWQLPLKEEGKPSRIIQINWYHNQDAENLFQRLRNIVFTLDEEDIVTLADVKARVNLNLSANSDKNIKEFYKEFKIQHKAFLAYIKGIDDKLPDDKNTNKKWYASLMLNRLMFCYFIQKRKFLDWNDKYLTDKLAECKKLAKKDSFYGFYRSFLLELFHNELSYPEEKRKKPSCPVPFGKIPYLNGGLFDVHGLEKEYTGITIKDEIFDQIFAFFEQYEWHLDTRRQSSGREVNPDVIGFVFEKYINDRASMGAYYTKEDITDYIGKNTIIPFILDKVKAWYKEPFEMGGAFWQYLQTSGNDFIYDSVKKGIPDDAKNIDEIGIPAAIKTGIDTKTPNLLERRKDWNTAAQAEFALPTEIWREAITRFERYFEVKNEIAGGKIQQSNDLITYNLNIKKLLSDFLEQTQDAKFIRTLYKILPTVTILDPTCGSGAFLFAAMNILEPLYEICIHRMKEFYEAEPSKNDDFRERLEDIRSGKHQNLRYYIFKTIILNNLYGVDIMNEAVEIAKLRLFLKLVAEVDPSRSKKNYGLEPLPDIDFNIKAGNTLVGFATERQIAKAFNDEFNFDTDMLTQIKQKCGTVAAAFKHFKDLQLGTGYTSVEMHQIKSGLQDSFSELNKDFDKHLAQTYKINAETEKKKFELWKKSHQPFHWFAEFYQIIALNGGFDVVIGNPPYVEYSQNKCGYTIKNYETLPCGNLYAFIVERALIILKQISNIGMIIPISSVANHKFNILQNIFLSKTLSWFSCYSNRPAKLFENVEQRLTIFVGKKYENICSEYYTCSYQHWYAKTREYLFHKISYTINSNVDKKLCFSKIGNQLEQRINLKLKKNKKRIIADFIINDSKCFTYYHNGPTYFIRAMSFMPNSGKDMQISSHYKRINTSEGIQNIISPILNSSLFYFFYKNYSNCRDFSEREIYNFPLGSISEETIEKLNMIEIDLNKNYIKNRLIKNRTYENGLIYYEEYYPAKSKQIIDEIDKILAKHYGFTDEELDFIINYDIKYRMGGELGGDAEGEE